MSLKSKLANVEKRLGVVHCPHCGSSLIPQAEEGVDYATLPLDERRAIVAQALSRIYDRESLPALLAAFPPSWRERVSDVNPLT